MFTGTHHYVPFEIRGERLHLYAAKAIFWPRARVLLVADLHLGKADHFRKAGIAVPSGVSNRNTENIIDIIRATRPEQVILMGDLFHSEYNPEWEVFGQIIRHFAHISFELIMGNHDVMSHYQYEKHGISLHQEPVRLAPFLLSHEPLDTHSLMKGDYNLAGHVHPGVRLRGEGRQGLTLPCFCFSIGQGLLPAFGAFTGLCRITPQRGDHIFVIAGGKVIGM